MSKKGLVPTLTAYVAGAVTVLAIAVGVFAFAVAAQAESATVRDGVYSATSVNEVSAAFDMRVTYFAVSPCGDASHVLGCWDPATPDVLWLSATIDTPELERWVLLHEIGHALHYQMGAPSSECGADMFARSMLGEVAHGADWNC